AHAGDAVRPSNVDVAALRVAFHAHRPDAAAHRAHRQETEESRRTEAGQRTHLVDGAPGERPPRHQRRAPSGWQLPSQRQRTLPVDARTDSLYRAQRGNQETSRDEQNDRRGDFRDHQRRAQPLSLTATAPDSFTQPLEVRRPAEAQHRREAERDASYGRQGDRESEHSQIDGRRRRNREIRRNKLRQQRYRKDRDANARRSPDRG